MNEQKHFTYESEDPVVVKDEETSNSDLEITDVQFMVPALVSLDFGDNSNDVMLNIDLANRKAYDKLGNLVSYNDKIFKHLDRVNTLPDDFFEASEDIYDKAEEARQELEEIKKKTKEGVE